MNEKITKKTTILFSVPGFGLSTAWQGNAIAAAKPANFNQLWENYQHFTLSSPYESAYANSSAERALPYAMISSGKIPVSNKTLVDKAISHHLLDRSELLKSFFVNIVKHNGVLHLIGNISDKSENGDLAHLIRLIKLAKKNFIAHVLVHIIVDETYASIGMLKNKLLELEDQLKMIGLGEIASISGQDKLLNDKKNQLPIDLFFENKCKRFLSIEQGLAKQKNVKPAELSPFILSENRVAITDFDGILLFNHTFDQLSPLLPFFLTEMRVISFKKKPRFVSLISLFDFPTVYQENLQAIFRRNNEQSISAKLKKLGKNHLLICDQKMKVLLSHYFCGNDSSLIILPVNSKKGFQRNLDLVAEDYMKELDKAVASDKFDLITLEFPLLAEVSAEGLFDQATQTVTIVDNLLAAMLKLQFEHNLDIIFISPFGLAEKIKTFSTYEGEQLLQPNGDPLPLIYISKDSKQRSKSINLIVDEIASAKQDLTKVYQILSNSLGL